MYFICLNNLCILFCVLYRNVSLDGRPGLATSNKQFLAVVMLFSSYISEISRLHSDDSSPGHWKT